MLLSTRLRALLFALTMATIASACEGNRAPPRVLVFGSPDAANAEVAATLVRLADSAEVELRMTADPRLIDEDSLAAYRALVLLNSSGDLLGRRQQADVERFVEAGGGFFNLGAAPARTWPWLTSLGAPDGEADGDGRVYQTSRGAPADFADPTFVEEVAAGFRFVAEGNPRYRGVRGERVPDSTRFEQQVLVEGSLNEPTEMAIASDGRVFFNQRRGTLKVFEPATGATRDVHHFELFTEDENGLIGIALDPNFEENGWIYLTRTVGDTTDIRHRVARFTYDGQGIGEEHVLLEVPIDRGCCHTGGSMTFDGNGNLLVSFGDNTNPFATAYAPIDDSDGRNLWDARRSSANSQDLRGKIVRITPQPDGSYTIPEGNLFADAAQGRPEIYTMGHRNPYRISFDRESGFLYWGEVGPDARIDSIYGPKGYDEVNQARAAGNFGWPLFIANNKPYRVRDFETGSVGQPFDPARPANESGFNSGVKVLPPAQPAFIYYPYDRSDEFPRVGEGGRTAMAGPVYHAADYEDSEVALPGYYDGKFINYEWIRGWMMATTMNENGDFVSMEPFLDNIQFDHPMDVEMGPDGSLYVLEYGTLWFAPNPGARLSRIVYHPDNRPPRARVSATPVNGAAPLQVTLSAEESFDPDQDDDLTFRWEFADESTAEGMAVQHTFAGTGSEIVRLVATDPSGAADTATAGIQIGNAPPEVAIEVAGNRSFFWEAAPANYHVVVRDAEDGTLGTGIRPEAVRVTMDYQSRSVIEPAVPGHQVEQTPAGLAYIQQGDCTGCHGIDQASAGPAYRSVAQRYVGDPGAEARLVAKVLGGGTGVWGEQVMPAHPDLSEDVAGEIVRYILSLATPGEPLPVDGTLAFEEHQAGEAGAYVLTASYVDQPRNGIAPNERRTQLVLRAPQIRAADIADSWGMGAPDSTAAEAADAAVTVEIDGAYLHLGAIDLTGVDAMTAQLADVREGFTIELRAGGPAGEQLGSGEVPDAGANGAIDVTVPITATGERDLYVVFRTDAAGLGPWSPLARVRTLRFDRADSR